MHNSEILNLAQSALVKRWRQIKGGAAFRTVPPPQGRYENYVTDWKDNLLPTVSFEDVEADYRKGAGQELKEKFCAAYSSAALAANCFGPFRVQKEGRAVPGIAGAKGLTLHFEQPLPHGLQMPPVLDVVMRGSGVLVAVESKCTEFLSKKDGKFKPAYDTLVKKMEAGWREVFDIIRKEPEHFGGFDAAQLVKHYLGIRHSAQEYRKKVLLYLFWEPLNADSIQAFHKHRQQIEEFSKKVEGSEVKFLSQSYPKLWESWSSEASPEVREHLNQLKERYLVKIPI